MNERIVFCCVSPDLNVRRRMIANLAVRMKLATIMSDAMKLISDDIYSFDLMADYIILCDTVDFAENTKIAPTLLRRALMGAPVVVGVKKITKNLDSFCRFIYPEELRKYM